MSSAVWRTIISIGHITYSFVDRHTHTHPNCVFSRTTATTIWAHCTCTNSKMFNYNFRYIRPKHEREVVAVSTCASRVHRAGTRQCQCKPEYASVWLYLHVLCWRDCSKLSDFNKQFSFGVAFVCGGVRRVCIEGTNRRNMQHAHHTRTTARRHMPHNTIVRFIIIVVVVVDETIGGSNLTRVNCCITPPNISFWFDSFDFKWRNETSDVHWFVFHKPS